MKTLVIKVDDIMSISPFLEKAKIETGWPLRRKRTSPVLHYGNITMKITLGRNAKPPRSSKKAKDIHFKFSRPNKVTMKTRGFVTASTKRFDGMRMCTLSINICDGITIS